jgi:hypothetical protein
MAKGLSRMKGNFHVRFLGGWRVVTPSGYPVGPHNAAHATSAVPRTGATAGAASRALGVAEAVGRVAPARWQAAVRNGREHGAAGSCGRAPSLEGAWWRSTLLRDDVSGMVVKWVMVRLPG